MNSKVSLGAKFLLGCRTDFIFSIGHSSKAQGRPSQSDRNVYTRNLAGFKVRLIAVQDVGLSASSLASDHAWWPDGAPYQGPVARLTSDTDARAHAQGFSRGVVLELEPTQARKKSFNPFTHSIGEFEDSIPHAIAWLPNSSAPNSDTEENLGLAGPIPINLFFGAPNGSPGNTTIVPPTQAAFQFCSRSDETQPIEIGIAQGGFTTVVSGAASVPKLDVDQSATIASGPWGRIELTRLHEPFVQSKPSPTHRFRLLGGPFPPKTERKAYFYNSKGVWVASCNEGTRGSGFIYKSLAGDSAALDIGSFKIVERPISSVRFDDVTFKAPLIEGYRGQAGEARSIDSSIGKVQGVLVPTKDGPWTGDVLYAADGIRWLDPGQEFAEYEHGQFDPWNQPLDPRSMILFAPKTDLISSGPPTTCEIYASDSADGPDRERLTSWSEVPLRGPLTAIPCSPTPRAFMHLKIRVGDLTWKTLVNIPVTDQMLHISTSASPGTSVLQVLVDDSGGIRVYKDEPLALKLETKWRPGEQSLRFIARMRGGETAQVNFNMGGSGGDPPHQTHYHGIELTRQPNGTLVLSGTNRIDLSKIASLQLQAQDLQPATTVAVHSPIE